jgi:hypothetical protein
MGQNIYEIIACNFLFNFIPKELFYMKNKEFKIRAETWHYTTVQGTDFGDMWQTPLPCSAQTMALKG